MHLKTRVYGTLVSAVVPNSCISLTLTLTSYSPTTFMASLVCISQTLFGDVLVAVPIKSVLAQQLHYDFVYSLWLLSGVSCLRYLNL